MSKTVALVGGGSGGHVTPLLAVAEQLKALDPSLHLVYVGEKGGKFSHLADGVMHESILIFAGKFRRYHGRGKLAHALDVKTNLFNLRDVFYIIFGFLQSFFYLLFHRPAIIFIKGGFVGVPIGYSARILRIPYITHDSDTIPGLANRLISKGASLHLVAMPESFYAYPADKMRSVGLPLADNYSRASDADRIQAKRGLQVSPEAKVVFITGGSLGAKRLNDALVTASKNIIRNNPSVILMHNVGAGSVEELTASYKAVLTADELSHVKPLGYLTNMYDYIKAADIVVTRAGATALAEAGAIGSALIVVPNPELTGGHQVKNAQNMKSLGAIEVVTEKEIEEGSSALELMVTSLLHDAKRTQELRNKLHEVIPPNASKKVAELLIERVGS